MPRRVLNLPLANSFAQKIVRNFEFGINSTAIYFDDVCIVCLKGTQTQNDDLIICFLHVKHLS